MQKKIRKKIWLSLFVLFSFPTGLAAQDNYDIIKNEFLNPSPGAKPKVYWWCLNGNIDTLRAREEIQHMKEAGIGGFDFFEIGTPSGDSLISAGPAFLSDESLKVIKFVVEEAGKSGLTVGLNLASSWNAGGSWIEPKHAGKSLYYSKTEVKGSGKKRSFRLSFPEIKFSNLVGGISKQLVPFGNNGRPLYYEEVAVLAIPADIANNSLDTTNIIDITPYFDKRKDRLKWKAPPGNWHIYRYVSANSGQQLVLPSPFSAGLTIDHFDSSAVAFHLNYIINRLSSVLGDLSATALKSFYLASYEARGLVWTPSLAREFQRIYGYDLRKLIPFLSDPQLFKPEITHRVQIDFKKTLSELMIHNLYLKSKEICNRYGLKINSEAGGPGYPLYNGPAEPLKALGSLDIPRGEFWINHSRKYLSKPGKDSIDILRVVKEVAAASHIYEKGIVEQEAFTSFQHWQEGPGDMKPFGDRAFSEGMNKVVFHGFSHNIKDSGFPGYAYHAGTHINDKRVWWPKAKPFIEYLTRVSAVARKTDFVADVLWYYGDKIPNTAAARNTYFTAGPGYDYEVINTEILLNKLSVKNGKLVLSNGASFSLLVLEQEASIRPDVLKKLHDLVQQGALVIGEKPEHTAPFAHSTETLATSKTLLHQLWTDAKNIPGNKTVPGNPPVPNNPPVLTGHIYSGTSPEAMLETIGILPDIRYMDMGSNLLDFIHYSKKELDIYFVSNQKDQWISRNIGFRQRNKAPEIWDPVSGDIIPVPIFHQEKQYINLPLTLPPFGSLFVVFKKDKVSPEYSRISSSGPYPPMIQYTKEGICFLQNEPVTMMKKDKSFTFQNENRTSLLEGSWEVSFTRGWGAPEKAVFPKLISWTNSEIEGIKYYSGTASYKKLFQFNMELVAGQKIYLDLGELSKIGELWVNGERLGISWTEPHRFDVTNVLKQGENSLKIEIANTWSNRLTGDAITGKKFTSTNISGTVIPSPTLEAGDQTHYPWEKVPLIRSGLLGPVSLIVINPVK